MIKCCPMPDVPCAMIEVQQGPTFWEIMFMIGCVAALFAAVLFVFHLFDDD